MVMCRVYITPSTACRRHIYVWFIDYHDHVVLYGVYNMTTPSPWSPIYWYILWFYIFSNPYIIWVSAGNPPRRSHQKILEEEHAWVDHYVDVLHSCFRINYWRSCHKYKRISERRLLMGHLTCDIIIGMMCS